VAMVDRGKAQDVARARRHDRRPPRLRRGGGRLCLAGLAGVGACVALSAAAHAGVKPLDTALPTSRTLISPQYQAKKSDTAAGIGTPVPAADPLGGGAPRVAAGADQGRRPGKPAGYVEYSVVSARAETGWYRARELQYQLFTPISPFLGNTIVSAQFNSFKPILKSTNQSIVGQMTKEKVISNSARGRDPQDARELLQLGVMLALAYVLFLAFWFWKTRHRPHGARRVVRF
jgi:hypothetical protein